MFWKGAFTAQLYISLHLQEVLQALYKHKEFLISWEQALKIEDGEDFAEEAETKLSQSAWLLCKLFAVSLTLA